MIEYLINQLIALLEQLRDKLLEWVYSTPIGQEFLQGRTLDEARLAAEGGDETALTNYLEVIQDAYGVTFNISFWDDDSFTSDQKYQMLVDFQNALEQMALYLQDSYFDEDTRNFINSYEFFQAVMRDISFEYVDFNPSLHGDILAPPLLKDENGNWLPCKEGVTYSLGRAYTEGHKITFFKGSTKYICEDGKLKVAEGAYNLGLLSDSGQSDEESIENVDNIIHELAHSLNSFSGFGDSGPGLLVNLLVGQPEIGAAIAACIGHDRIALLSQRDDPGEIQADLILMLAACPDLIDAYPQLKEVIRRGTRNAILYHTSPDEYAAVLGTSLPLQRAEGTGVKFRVNSPATGALEGTQITLGDGRTSYVNVAPDSFDSTKNEEGTVYILGITQIGYTDNSKSGSIQRQWVYVAIPDGQGTQYYWIRRDSFENQLEGNIDWSSVPELQPGTSGIAPFENLDPARPFDTDDEYNPPISQSREGE